MERDVLYAKLDSLCCEAPRSKSNKSGKKNQVRPKTSTDNDRLINESIYEALKKKVPEGAQARDLLVQSL